MAKRTICIACSSRDCIHIAPAPATLTPSECQMIRLVESGKLNKEIALVMGLTEQGGAQKLSCVYRKLRFSGAGSRMQLGRWARDHAELLAA